MSTIANTSAVTTTTSNTSNGTTSTNGQIDLASNFTSFLTLLTTQLKNQDPTSPIDSNQFTQQLVAFAGVQQQTQTNSLLQQLVTLSQGNQISAASSFVGTNIEASGNQGALVNGTAQFGYTLSANAATANVTISDSTGAVVFSGTGSTNTGSNIVTWDGTNSITGEKEPDGIYTIKVTAKDTSGGVVGATPFVTGTVTSASVQKGSVMLSIGALQIPQSSVTNISNLSGKSQSIL